MAKQLTVREFSLQSFQMLLYPSVNSFPNEALQIICSKDDIGVNKIFRDTDRETTAHFMQDN